MKKLFTLLGLLVVTAYFASTATAQGPVFEFPDNARLVSQNVYSLGKKVDPQSNKVVEGYMIVERGKKQYAKPTGVGGGGKTACYGFLAKGARWKGSLEPWVMNTSNIDGLDGVVVKSLMDAAIDKWEAAAGTQILGDGTVVTNTLVAEESGSPDGVNEVYFADIEGDSSIGVTIVWGVFGGPISGRQLVEWDQIYDDVTFNWSASASGVSGMMDFDSIATHELGHTVGLGDLYDAACNQETMYGYASEGEINKRSLNPGDIAGIQVLY